MSQRDLSLELVVVIMWAVDLPVASLVAHRRVNQDGARRIATIDSRCIYDRLERRPELTERLHRPVELAPAEAPSPDHGLDLTGPIVDRDERRLREWRLFERDDCRLTARIDRLDGDFDQIAWLEEVCGSSAPSPSEPVTAEIGVVRTDSQASGIGRSRFADGSHD